MVLIFGKRYNLFLKTNKKLRFKLFIHRGSIILNNESNYFRLIISKNNSAKQNMGMDKALFQSFKKDDRPILRLYTWEKSFTVGISQKCEDYTSIYNEYNNNCAKRMTGGGVLFHGDDISYSLILPSTYLKDLNVKQTYEEICSFLLDFYKELNLSPAYAKDIEKIQLRKSNFCQVGFEAYDIIIKDLKIGGNAQKRAKNVIFQHGSIPLRNKNRNKQSGNTLEDIGIKLNVNEAIEKLCFSFEKTFKIKLKESYLNTKENEYLDSLLKD